jgi:sporulation protein YlmC with PRC-barrel domain
MSDVIGHKIVTRSGRLLGSIDDMLIDGADGTIIGFAVGEGVRNKLENIFNPQRSRVHGYVRADADLHVGNDLVVVPDDALIEGEPSTREDDNKPATQKTDELEHGGWSERAAAESTRSSIWTRRTDAPTRSASQTSAETGFESETTQPIASTRASTAAKEVASENPPPDREAETVSTVPHDQQRE